MEEGLQQKPKRLFSSLSLKHLHFATRFYNTTSAVSQHGLGLQAISLDPTSLWGKRLTGGWQIKRLKKEW